MQKEFLALYYDELQTFRRQATAFAKTHPGAAAKLRLSDGVADDPHVERLIESFAFISARIRQKLDDSFPELSAGLLDALYPHLLAPRPSMSLVSLIPSPDLASVHPIARGLELLSTDIRGDKCRFRTTQDISLIPAKITAVRYETNLQAGACCPFKTAQSALKIHLSPLKKEGNLGAIGLETIRFHLAGAWDQASLLYMHIFLNAVGISLSDSENITQPVFLSDSHIQQAGFADEESLLPVSAHFHTGLRLLSEFFAFKRKFLFFDISGLEKWNGKTLELAIYFNCQNPALTRNLSADNITLNTSPVINLFRQHCEPVSVSSKREHYPLVPDLRFRHSRKFHSVECISATMEGKAPVQCYPAYHATAQNGTADLVWQVIREPEINENEDCKISFSGNALEYNRQIITQITALCTNAGLPNQLPYNAGYLQLLPAKPHSEIAGIYCLLPFTPPVPRPYSDDQMWRFIAHLRLNHLSMTSDTGKALRDILQLYLTDNDADGQKFISAIQNVTATPSTCRIKQGGFAAATNFNIHFSDNILSHAEIFIFGTIINRFLQLYTSINSFCRVTARMDNFAEPVFDFPFHPSMRNSV
ncbi:type VI secretion system baseplate subunit TssF [Pseudochrobactrum sp. HB0163]|uniref:type VI secretion system baseplate subunit TssF n=1 Tax=Pseudochrobactrum sp. HB0163 TaxID=3450708 RepID=UPI003F6DAFA0